MAGGFFFWASQTSWAWSLPRTSVAISSLLHNFTPIFVILGGWLVGGKRFNIQFLLGTTLSIIGSGLIGIEHLSNSSNQIQGDIAAILSAAFLGGYMLVGETLCSQFSKVTIMFWVCTTGTVLSIPVLLIAGMECFPKSVQGWIFAVSLILTMVLGQGFFLMPSNELAHIRNQKLGFVFQQFHLLPQLTAWENVMLPMVYGGVSSAERRDLAVVAKQRVGLHFRGCRINQINCRADNSKNC